MKQTITRQTLPLLFALLALVLLLTAQLLPSTQQQTASAATAAASSLNAVQKENQRLGTPNWRITNPAPLNSTTNTYQGIEGYPSLTSVGVGSTISFHVNSSTTTFSAIIYRLGWYQGVGARQVQTLNRLDGRAYAIPAPRANDGLVEAQWPSAFTVNVPSTWVSGLYLVKLTNAIGLQSYIPFIVKSTRHSDLVFIHSANTDEASNQWGGTSLFQDTSNTLAAGRAYRVSFDRPFAQFYGAGHIFYWEYPMIRWLERNGYDVSYVSDVDVHTTTSALLGHHGVLIVGHSEFWSGAMRSHLETAVSKGVSLGAFGGNDIYFQVRYENSTQQVPNRVITCFQDASLDPLSSKHASLATVEFRSQPVSNAEQHLLGSMSAGTVSTSFPWVVNDASSWVFANSGLNNGDSIPGLVGYLYDRVFTTVPFAFPTPATTSGVDILSASPVTDSANNADVANSTLYTAQSGARIFNAGTIQWSWGLDDFESASALNPAIQQITANLLHNFITGSTDAATTGNN